MKHIRFLYILICLVLLTGSCTKDPVIPNEEELITTLIWTLTPFAGGNVSTFTFRDPDGNGGLPPEIMVDTLLAGRTYLGRVELYNESTNPITDLTQEIIDESEAHQIFYTLTSLNATISYSDMDPSGFPIGLMTGFVPATAGQGAMRITLRHQPDKSAGGVSGGNILNAGGETDIEVTFPVVIQ